ncbi:indole-3-glycerol phosphate synthase TrpC [Chlorobium phaeovibrioides]|uniref:Indole-3-glycerol phosphate synthase n=1 Tax=Chlorobium phaeovibrioides TaxID=1094 RepID=A0A3S0MR53_CHLPH|nr:indole-3-glycerol phosphate synthase TrpC [Chlorobium phaeovibrioides]KAA6233061.1 indole-3-glycerol phosphate synthase TrpC [Chlorobium phaeovibrioides]MWV53642.1 indole-3-glycerol phosphate synthase TrpC [Chlorobium phaeovibrioides]QEQ56548.1 indole-3-glycerol phosphate synthase TrpC [Chlorobium phaeovibrioides]RTY35840.1 indole-3-glycerol phosphate synthase TrpC [Chlorobium phaeovibrioides]RTY39152.1 indole-3-glycerol phosphate synthase TrpC [Chlorobium phaeovibrioides]
MKYLSAILEEKRREVEALKRQNPSARYRDVASSLPSCRGFARALQGEGGSIRLIAEVKKASPSRGVIVEDFDPVRIALAYEALGASALSVLTDRHFFQGSAGYLQQVAAAVSLPVLRKDFIIDELQIFESRTMGADAILLIVAALEPSELHDYLQMAGEIGLDVLVEVHDRHELALAIESGAEVVGVNNRNLKDFSVDPATSASLRPYFPSGVIAVSESGLKTADDIALVRDAGFDAVLIGEGLQVSSELRSLSWPNA